MFGNNAGESQMEITTLKKMLLQQRQNYSQLEIENFNLKEKIQEQEKIIANNALYISNLYKEKCEIENKIEQYSRAYPGFYVNQCESIIQNDPEYKKIYKENCQMKLEIESLREQLKIMHAKEMSNGNQNNIPNKELNPEKETIEQAYKFYKNNKELVKKGVAVSAQFLTNSLVESIKPSNNTQVNSQVISNNSQSSQNYQRSEQVPQKKGIFESISNLFSKKK